MLDARTSRTDAAVADFEARIRKYEEVYEELGPEERHLTWIKLVDGGRQVSTHGLDAMTSTQRKRARLRILRASPCVGSCLVWQLSMNNIRGFLPSRIAQFLVNLHVDRRSFFFSRHGQSEYNRLGKIGGDSDLTEHGEA